MKQKHLLCFGFGFSAKALAGRLDRQDWRITGTSRTDEGTSAITAQGFEAIRFDLLRELPDTVTHIVSSVPPGTDGDPVLQRFAGELAARADAIAWCAYLSTTGVYGDHAGAWVNEDTPLTPNTERGQRRLLAEQAWMRLNTQHGLPVHVFRLAGIYGPGRNTLLNLQAGTARRVIKPGQIFSRIHVDDIAGVLLASMANPRPGRAYNVADDKPGPPQDVVAYGAGLLGLPVPPDVPFAQAGLSPMAQSFYEDSKRVSNARMKAELGYKLLYPDYKTGLLSVLNHNRKGQGKGPGLT